MIYDISKSLRSLISSLPIDSSLNKLILNDILKNNKAFNKISNEFLIEKQ